MAVPAGMVNVCTATPTVKAYAAFADAQARANVEVQHLSGIGDNAAHLPADSGHPVPRQHARRRVRPPGGLR
ncbi:MAG: hypothetical protein ACYCV7_17460 [Acidimicrobiales bacterium]